MGKVVSFEDFFSLPILLRTWVAPWKDDVQVARNIALDDQVKLWEANFVSRVVGSTIRTFVITFGVITIGLAGVIGVVGIICWVIMPLLIIILPITGLIVLL